MRAFILAILAVGIIRFILSVAGFPNTGVKFASMSIVILLALIYFALTTATHKERLQASFLLVLPYMVIEVAALAYSWFSGHQTIFHADEYDFDVSLGRHLIGHFIGGLTWEPLIVFIMMEIAWLISIPVSAVLRRS